MAYQYYENRNELYEINDKKEKERKEDNQNIFFLEIILSELIGALALSTESLKHYRLENKTKSPKH